MLLRTNTNAPRGALHSLLGLGLTGTLMLLAAPGDLKGQGSCSVPSTSAGNPFGGGVRTLAPGSGHVENMLFHLDTRSHYDGTGNARDFFAQGRLIVTSSITNVAAGLLDGVEVRGQLPVHRLSFQEVSGSRDRTGVGDPRVEVRLGPQLLGAPPDPFGIDLVVRGGVKLPGEDFPVDAQIIPLTEGQRDWELALEFGRSLADGLVNLQGWAGYRWRERNESIERDPGNERFGFLSVGGPLPSVDPFGSVGWSLGAQWLSGSPHRLVGVRVPSTRREILEFFPRLTAPVGPGWAGVGARIPASGRNLPAGTAFSLSYSFGWGGGDH